MRTSCQPAGPAVSARIAGGAFRGIASAFARAWAGAPKPRARSGAEVVVGGGA
jgi:hypothetical protein